VLLHLTEVTWKAGGTAKISTKLEKKYITFENVYEIYVEVTRS
jgi:hypothetical protein